jgi:hypothetical protein
MMKYQKIFNFETFLQNCDTIGNYHCIQIYKDLLHALSNINLLMNYESFFGLTETEKRVKLNAMIDYFVAEGIIVQDPITGKIRTTTDVELNAEIADL